MPQFTTTTTYNIGRKPFYTTTTSKKRPGKTGRFLLDKHTHINEDDPDIWTPEILDIPDVEYTMPSETDDKVGGIVIDRSTKSKINQTYNLKKKKSITYKCGGDDEDDSSNDDDYIEVPGGTESVTYTDDEGQTYEVDVGDLIYYDGDDNEIIITKGRNKTKTPKKKVKKPTISPMIIQQRMYQRYRM